MFNQSSTNRLDLLDNSYELKDKGVDVLHKPVERPKRQLSQSSLQISDDSVTPDKIVSQSDDARQLELLRTSRNCLEQDMMDFITKSELTVKMKRAAIDLISGNEIPYYTILEFKLY